MAPSKGQVNAPKYARSKIPACRCELSIHRMVLALFLTLAPRKYYRRVPDLRWRRKQPRKSCRPSGGHIDFRMRVRQRMRTREHILIHDDGVWKPAVGPIILAGNL